MLKLKVSITGGTILTYFRAGFLIVGMGPEVLLDSVGSLLLRSLLA